MANNKEINALVLHHGYVTRPTGGDASHQNAPGERPHQTIGHALRTMLHGAGLPFSYWPYAFDHAIMLHNIMPHGPKGVPVVRAGGPKPNIKDIRTFGCHVIARPPGPRPSKLENHANQGTFLGYAATRSQARYLDAATGKTKLSAHIRYDEGMCDGDSPSPNARQLRAALGHSLPQEEVEIPLPTELDLVAMRSPFTELITVSLKVCCDHVTLGFVLGVCSARSRVFIVDILPNSSAGKIRDWRRKYKGGYIVEMDHKPVFTQDDATRILGVIRREAHTKTDPTFTLVIAPDHPPLKAKVTDGIPRLQMDQFRTAISALYELGEGQKLHADDIPCDGELSHAINSVTEPDILPGTKWTRRQLKPLGSWPEWYGAEKVQLDQMRDAKMFGRPQKRPPNAVVLRSVWTYTVKHDGRKKARTCCDGSILRSPTLKYAQQCYSACISQTGMKLFFACLAIRNWIALGADATNAYAQTDIPSDDPQYIAVDRQMVDWWWDTYKERITTDMVMQILKALQGHPRAGQLWGEKVEKDLTALNFHSLKHETCLYLGRFEGHEILCCRQTDDFLFGGEDEAVLRRLIGQLGGRVVIVAEEGLTSHYNGLEIVQARDYVHIHVAPYLDKIIATHGWSEEGNNETRLIEPLHPSSIKELETSEGPEDPAEARAIEKSAGFGYRTGIGEIIFAYVTCRLDIGYAITELAKFSIRPAACHYNALKRVFKYLRQTRNYGLVFWRSKPLNHLPHIPFVLLRPMELADEGLPHPASISTLCAYVDAAHANCLRTRRSIGAFVFCLAGAAVAYRAKWIPTVCCSSTEAEFLIAVTAAKVAKYLRAVLNELGLHQEDATDIYEDNAAAIMMANARRPTERSRHIDIQNFALQEWVQNKDVILKHVRGVLNPSDALTKATGWILHHRHCTRVMGMMGSPYSETTGKHADC